MASIASSPLTIENFCLQTNPPLPLNRAHSFQIWKEHQVRIFCITEADDHIYQTTLCLMLETQENVDACVKALMKNQKIQAEVVRTTSVKVKKSDEAISLHVRFRELLDRTEFLTYAMPELPELEPTLPELEPTPTLNKHDLTLTLKEGKINEIFHRIAHRFGWGGGLFVESADREFPTPDLSLPKPVTLSRMFIISREGILEDLPRDRGRLNKTSKDILEWIEKPNLLLPAVIKEYKDVLKTKFEIAMKAGKIDEASLQLLLRLAKGFPSEDAKSF